MPLPTRPALCSGRLGSRCHPCSNRPHRGTPRYAAFFVYGTLKPGEPNYARYLAGQTASEAPATLAGAALFTEGPYPFLVTTPDIVGSAEVVHGTIIALRPPVYALVLADLDRLEGYVPGGAQNLYERVELEVTTSAGPRRSWVYLAGEVTLAQIRAGRLRHIPGGVWAARP